MKGLLRISGLIDRLNQWLGKVAVWAMFLSCMISAGNATSRYLFSMSSNAWLEIQWYLFGACVLLGAAAVLQTNEHVRVDVLYHRYPVRTKAWVDLLGLLLFLMPAVLLILWLSWPWFLESLRTAEQSGNAGGLIRWPAKLMLPLGFASLGLQGVSEIIKRAAYLKDPRTWPMDLHYEAPLQ